MSLAHRQMAIEHRADWYAREGEEMLCGIAILGGEREVGHAAWHHRSQVVMDAAMESSKRGDGRFLEGPGDVVVSITRGLTTFHGATARAIRSMASFAEMLTPDYFEPEKVVPVDMDIGPAYAPEEAAALADVPIECDCPGRNFGSGYHSRDCPRREAEPFA